MDQVTINNYKLDETNSLKQTPEISTCIADR